MARSELPEQRSSKNAHPHPLPHIGTIQEFARVIVRSWHMPDVLIAFPKKKVQMASAPTPKLLKCKNCFIYHLNLLKFVK
jgi:hypothetical protein